MFKMLETSANLSNVVGPLCQLEDGVMLQQLQFFSVFELLLDRFRPYLNTALAKLPPKVQVGLCLRVFVGQVVGHASFRVLVGRTTCTCGPCFLSCARRKNYMHLWAMLPFVCSSEELHALVDSYGNFVSGFAIKA